MYLIFVNCTWRNRSRETKKARDFDLIITSISTSLLTDQYTAWFFCRTALILALDRQPISLCFSMQLIALCCLLPRVKSEGRHWFFRQRLMVFDNSTHYPHYLHEPRQHASVLCILSNVEFNNLWLILSFLFILHTVWLTDRARPPPARLPVISTLPQF